MKNLNNLNVTQTALIIVDIQNDFCSSNGVCAQNHRDVSPIQNMVLKLDKFITQMRELGVKIIFTKQYEISQGAPRPIQTLFRQGKLWPECAPNSWGADFYALKPTAKDLVIEKRSWDAFTNKKLNVFLKKNGINTVIITGTLTTICVESTARRAFSEGYDVIIPKDLVAVSKDKEAHEKQSLKFFDGFLGEVVSSADLLKRLH